MKVFIDIETIPGQPESVIKDQINADMKAPANMKNQETIDAWHHGQGKYAGVKLLEVDKAYRKTALDATQGELLSVAYAIEDEEPKCFIRELDHREEDLLREFMTSLMTEHDKNPNFYWIGHNVGAFDLKFLYQRCVIKQVRPPFKLNQAGRHGKEFYDTMQAWAGYRNFISLDNLCAALGMPGKDDDIDGSKIWDHVLAGQLGRIKEYNVDDVNKVRNVYNRLEFLL